MKINTIDIDILYRLFSRSFSIGELQREVKIAYKNFSPHLKKLERFRIIRIRSNGIGKPKIVSLNVDRKISLLNFIKKIR
jgi:DNA-binding HxlR family transcriptional regulator